MKLYAILSDEALAASRGNRGKMAAQCGHAFARCEVATSHGDARRHTEYLDAGEAKIVLRAPNSVLVSLSKHYTTLPVASTIVRDAGRTVLLPGTLTCLGIGPIREDEVTDDLRNLPVWI